MLGETVQFRPVGNSMSPLLKSKQLVTVKPIKELSDVKVGDVVLCMVRGCYLLHKVYATGCQFQIGNQKGFINGWTSIIFGVVEL